MLLALPQFLVKHEWLDVEELFETRFGVLFSNCCMAAARACDRQQTTLASFVLTRASSQG
jgi:hypothetical protein